MKNPIKKLLFIIVLIFKLASVVHAVDNEAGASAKLRYQPQGPNKNINLEEQSSFAKQKEAIRRLLEERKSPLLSEVDAFMDACTKYALPCYLLPSITGLESSFGLYTAPGTFNGFGWGGGYIAFKNWADGIDIVGRGLSERYVPNIAKSEIDPFMIGPKYAESPTWAIRVSAFMKQFEAEEEKIRLNRSDINI